MTLEAGKEMDRRCVMNWLIAVYQNPTVAFNTHSDEQQMEFAYDALVLLKEQEAKPMTEYDDGWDCPRCGLKLIGKTASGYPYNWLDLPNDEIVKYCPVCGQAVKLDV